MWHVISFLDLTIELCMIVAHYQHIVNVFRDPVLDPVVFGFAEQSDVTVWRLPKYYLYADGKFRRAVLLQLQRISPITHCAAVRRMGHTWEFWPDRLGPAAHSAKNHLLIPPGDPQTTP